MVFTLIRTYEPGKNVFTTEKLYLFDNHVKAIERFNREYPECKNLIHIASSIDAADPKNSEFIQAHIKAYY